MFFLLSPVFVAASTLVFTGLQHLGFSIIIYTPHEATIDGTKVKLEEGGRLTVEGLSDSKYLVSFREGNLVFPSNPADQTVDHELQVYSGDEFIWFEFKGNPPQSFIDKLFDVVRKTSQEELLMFRKEAEEVCTFTLAESITLSSRIGNKLASWNRFTPPAFFIFVFIFIVGIAMLLIHFLRSKPPGDPCFTPESREYRSILFDYGGDWTNFDLMNLEVPKNCSKTALFNLTEYMDRIMDCLPILFPDRVPYSWQRIRASSISLYYEMTPLRNCSLPPQ